MSASARRLTLGAVAIGGALTLASVFLPFVHFAYRNPETHVALNAIEAVIALVAAYLIFGRFRERGLARDAFLVYALVLLASTNLMLSVLVRAFGSWPVLLGWVAFVARLFGATALFLASLAGQRVARLPMSHPALLPAASLGSLLVVGGLVGVLGTDLPFGAPAVLDPATTAGPRLEGHPLLLAGQVILFVLFAVTSVRFTMQAQLTGDPLLRWLGAGAALASIARVNYFLFPSMYSSFIYTGDILRLGFYLALLAGASAEVRAYWRRLEADTVERERLIGELQGLSSTDPLTGLHNRRSFVSATEQELKLHRRADRSVACVFIDLDDMKGINDRFGHEAGDDALRKTADLLRSSFRDSDLIARLGGDEFCVLIAEGDAERAVARLRKALDERASTDVPYPLSLSIGLARFDPSEHLSVEDLVAAADRKMYEEKADGRRR